MNTENATPASRGRMGRWWAIGGLGVLLLYGLSSGPAIRLMQHRMVQQEIVEAIYLSPHSPIQLVAGILPGGESLLKWYVGLWVE